MQGGPGPRVIGEESEFREPEIAEDLASDSKFALIHGHHLRTDAVGSREVRGVDVFAPPTHFVQ